jgi:hypothetical protein
MKISYPTKLLFRTMLRELPPLGIIMPHSNNSIKHRRTSEALSKNSEQINEFINFMPS